MRLDPIVERDLQFHFSHGQPLELTVRDGRDAIQDIGACRHCGAAARYRITQVHEDGSETTHNVHADKLNGASSTKRIVQPEPAQQLEELVDAIG